MEIGKLREKISQICNKYPDDSFCSDITTDELIECIGYLETIIKLNRKINISEEECELALIELQGLLQVRELTIVKDEKGL